MFSVSQLFKWWFSVLNPRNLAPELMWTLNHEGPPWSIWGTARDSVPHTQEARKEAGEAKRAGWLPKGPDEQVEEFGWAL